MRRRPCAAIPIVRAGAFLLDKGMTAFSRTPRAAPPPVPAPLARAHARYWRFNVMLIAMLMTIGFTVSFAVPYFAPALAGVRFAGFSLPFYMGAQGAILVYLVLIAVYIGLMQRADRTLRREYDDYAAHADATRGGGR